MPISRSPTPWETNFVLTPPPAVCRRRTQQIERQEQAAYFDMIALDIAAGKTGADMVFAIANETGVGGRGGLKIGVARKRTGRRPGVPDICVPVPRPGCPGLYIELKRPGGKPSDVSAAQREWHRKLRRQGYQVNVCYGWQAAYDVTSAYLGWDDIAKAKARARSLAEEVSSDA